VQRSTLRCERSLLRCSLLVSPSNFTSAFLLATACFGLLASCTHRFLRGLHFLGEGALFSVRKPLRFFSDSIVVFTLFLLTGLRSSH